MLFFVIVHATEALTLPPLTSLATPEALRAHYFSSSASWLIPGRVLVGRYPGSCPSRPCDAATQRNRLAVLREHVCTFVSFQSELPPQDAIDLWPKDGISAQSNNAIQPQTEKFQRYYEDAGGIFDEVCGPTTFLHFGIPDRSVAPSLEALDAAVFDLRRRVLNGDRLYLHCWGGRGRTGLVSACLLGALYDELVDANEALERVQSYYRLREKGAPRPRLKSRRSRYAIGIDGSKEVKCGWQEDDQHEARSEVRSEVRFKPTD